MATRLPVDSTRCLDPDGDDAEVPDEFDYIVNDVEDKAETLNVLEPSSSSEYMIRNDEDEAQVPGEFDYVESFWSKLQPLEYGPLDMEHQVRLLSLLPHRGKPDSTIECSLSTCAMEAREHQYTAVKNTRGHPNFNSWIVIDGHRKSISTNVKVFLDKIRCSEEHVMLWIRWICLNKSDRQENNKDTHLYIQRVFAQSQKILDMDDYMDDQVFEEARRLYWQRTSRSKQWNSNANADRTWLPRYFPIEPRPEENPPRPFSYLPLDIIAGEIRLLLILPAANKSDPLEAHLAHEPLAQCVSFECLSYTWGSPEKNHDMLLNGQPFKITQNLDEVLRVVRDEEGPQLLWVDAICVNQADAREKARQVPRMHAIYSHAEGVIIWVGQGNTDIYLALDLTAMIYKTPWEFEGRMRELRPNSEPHMVRALKGMFDLISKPYFSRLWIVQEVAVSSIPTVFCGRRKVAWSSLLHAISYIYGHVSAIVEVMKPIYGASAPVSDVMSWFTALERIHRLSYHRALQERHQPSSLLHLALSSQTAKCVNPRDKIYGLYDLAKDSRLLDITIDYSKPFVEVYISFVKGSIDHYKSLDIICATQPCDSDQSFPSWCPDWRHEPNMHSLIQTTLPPIHNLVTIPTLESLMQVIPNLDHPIYRASRDTGPTCELAPDNVLGVAGLHIDTIKHVHQPSENFDGVTALMAQRDIARELTHRDGQRLSQDEIDRQFWSMLIGKSEVHNRDNHQHIDDISASSQGPPFPEHQEERIRDPIKLVMRARQLVFTERGFMGLAPANRAKVGSQLCILLGCSVPVLLDKNGEEYKFLGSCFVQGWMNGEMLDELGTTDEEIMDMVKMWPLFRMR